MLPFLEDELLFLPEAILVIDVIVFADGINEAEVGTAVEEVIVYFTL